MFYPQVQGSGYATPAPNQEVKAPTVQPLYAGAPVVNQEAKPQAEMPMPQTPYAYAQSLPKQPAQPLYAGAPNVPAEKDDEE